MKNTILILLFIFISCTNTKEQHQKIIVIQPLGDFNIEQAKSVFNKIKTINPNVVLRKNIPFSKKLLLQTQKQI